MSESQTKLRRKLRSALDADGARMWKEGYKAGWLAGLAKGHQDGWDGCEQAIRSGAVTIVNNNTTMQSELSGRNWGEPMQVEQSEPKRKISCRTNEKIADFIDYMLERVNGDCKDCRFETKIVGCYPGCFLLDGDRLANCIMIADSLVKVGLLRLNEAKQYVEVTE